MRAICGLIIAVLVCGAHNPAFADENLDNCKLHLGNGVYVHAVESGKKAIMSSPRNYESHYCLAEAWRLNGEKKLALQQMRIAERFAKENDELAARVSRNEISEAERTMLERKSLMPIYSRIGTLTLELGQTGESLNAYYRLHDLSKVLNNQAEEVTALSNLANVYHSMYKFDTALETYTKALQLTSSESIKSSILNNMAIVYGSKEDFVRAREYFNKALAIDEALKDQRAYIAHLLNLGLNYGAEHSYSGELSIFNKAILKARSVNDIYWEAVAHRYKGDFYRRMNNPRLARTWYTSASKLFAQAGATGEAGGAEVAIDELLSTKSYAGVVLDPKGFTGVILSVTPKDNDTYIVKEVFRQSIASKFPADLKPGAALDQESIKATSESVKQFYDIASSRFYVDKASLYIIGTGTVISASNRDLLSSMMRESVGKSPEYMSTAEKNVADFFGAVSAGKQNSSLLIDVQRLSSEIRYYKVRGGVGRTVIAEIPQGPLSAFAATKSRSVDLALQSIKSKLTAKFRERLRKNSDYTKRSPVVLTGDPVRAIATFTHPGNDKDFVTITKADLDKLISAVRKKQASYFNPSLEHITNTLIEQWAADEIQSIKESFTLDEMLITAEYLKMMFTELKIQEVNFSRWGSWLTGRLNMNSLEADKLSAAHP